MIDALQFVTNTGTTSPSYGGNGGSAYILSWDLTGGIHGIKASTYGSYVSFLHLFLEKNWI